MSVGDGVRDKDHRRNNSENVIAHVQFLKFPTDQERLRVIQGREKSGIIRLLTESLRSQHEDFSSLCVCCVFV